MERFGNKRVGSPSSTTGPNNRHDDDTRSDSSPLLDGYAPQQHSSLSDRKTEGQKSGLRIRIPSRKKDTTAAAAPPPKSPATDTETSHPRQGETDVDSPVESQNTHLASLSGTTSKDEKSRAKNGSTLLAAEAKRRASEDSTPNKEVDPLLCTEELDSTTLPTKNSKLHTSSASYSSKGGSVPSKEVLKKDSSKSSTASFARPSLPASSSSPDSGRKRRRNDRENKPPTPTPSPGAFSANVYASLTKPSPSPAKGGSFKPIIEKKKAPRQINKSTAKGAPSQGVKSSAKEVKVSPQGKKIPDSSSSQQTSPSHVGKAVVKNTDSSPALGVDIPRKPTTPSGTSPSTATMTQKSLSQKPALTDGTGPSPVTEAANTKEAPSNDSPRKPSSLELVKIQAQKKLEHELSLLVSDEKLYSPGMDTDTEVNRNEATDTKLARLPEESTVLRHESWKRLHEADNASAEKRAEAGRAARLALRKESHAYAKSLTSKLQNQRGTPSPVFVSRAPNSHSMSSGAGGTWRPAVASGAFISTTPSASAAYATKVTQENIRRAIPANASCVVHVMDRRVNLDACAPDASHYSLLRAWVQDDPCRQSPPPGSNIFESVPLSTCIPEGRNADIVLPKKRKIEMIETCNVLDSLVNAGEQDAEPLLNSLRDQLVINGKRLRREKRREEKAWMNAACENLKSMGIELHATSSRVLHNSRQ